MFKSSQTKNSIYSLLTFLYELCSFFFFFFLRCMFLLIYIVKKRPFRGTSLVIQQLRLCTFSARGMGSIPDCRTKIPYASWTQKLKKKKKEEEERLLRGKRNLYSLAKEL